ncbi:OLC1v1004386C1 [Oldenlandia corymbosa var. corymbosa]|uniref:OLC1v1004386C1 n=1 Tax=Oldenlandia corymbosa var. corymbosa TaxID=529605 RepID=A0AAV1DCU5_OLDCO|nr:OLC1v1004386C1 [Oldenlandia corymbosa var. corymbosa]
MKAEDEKFWQWISAKDETYSSFHDSEYDFFYEPLNRPNYRPYEDYRLCFCVNREHFVASEPSGPFTRSLLYIPITDTYPRCPYDISFIPDKFKLLRVLDLETINMGISFASGIDLLLNLKYLAVGGDIESIPPSLSKLQNLETLVVKGLKKKVVLPDTIWRMKNLKHVHVTNRAIFTLHFAEDASISRLDNLVSLSLPCFKCQKPTNDMIMRFPNLRYLSCVALGPSDDFVDFCEFLALESLSKLEELKIMYHGKVLNAGQLNFPPSLRKLTLSNFRLPWSYISVIRGLQNLEVLKLISQAFEGSSWDMEDLEFGKLKYLKLDTLDIAHWVASCDNLPELQQLVVKNCKQLEEISVEDFPTLQKIEVQGCGKLPEELIQTIKEVEGLEVVINN